MTKRVKKIRFIMTPWEVKVGVEMAGGGKCWNSIHNYLTDIT
jgi:hypothetical protein